MTDTRAITPPPPPSREAPAGDLLDRYGRHWGWLALRGVAAIVFGVLALAWPGLTLLALAIFWGAYALVDGVLALVNGIRMREDRSRGGRPMWPWLLVGVLGIAAGIVTFVWPGLSALVLLMLIAAWAVVLGVLQIAAAVRLRKEIEGEWLLGLSGLLSVVFGLLVVINPGAGALAVAWMIGAYSIAFGVLMFALGLRLRNRRRATGTMAPAA